MPHETVSDPVQQRHLTPTHYHANLLAYLQKNEPKVWEWAASQPAQDKHAETVREALLKSTYRLERSDYSHVFEHCETAMSALEIEAPLHLYQVADGQMNAALNFIPGEIHIVFYGALLETLEPDELLALLGHELSHYKLWSIESGTYHAVHRVIEHALTYPNISPSLIETARLLRLFTELYADRGGALACQSDRPPISTLVKVMAGLSKVNPDAYLKQAKEIETTGKAASGETHPEMFLRAQAVNKWWLNDDQVDAWLDDTVRGRLSLDTLDLLRQADMTHITASFLNQFRTQLEFESDAIDQLIKPFQDTAQALQHPQAPAWSDTLELDSSLQDYIFALIFDLAMIDRDTRDAVLIEGGHQAHRMDALDSYRSAMKRDLKLRKPTITRLTKTAGQSAA